MPKGSNTASKWRDWATWTEHHTGTKLTTQYKPTRLTLTCGKWATKWDQRMVNLTVGPGHTTLEWILSVMMLLTIEWFFNQKIVLLTKWQCEWFVCLFVCLFIYLFVCLFALGWIFHRRETYIQGLSALSWSVGVAPSVKSLWTPESLCFFSWHLMKTRAGIMRKTMRWFKGGTRELSWILCSKRTLNFQVCIPDFLCVCVWASAMCRLHVYLCYMCISVSLWLWVYVCVFLFTYVSICVLVK